MMSLITDLILREPGLRIIVSFVVQTTLIAALGLLFSGFLRRDAAKREWVLRVTLVCVLMVPVMTAVVHEMGLSFSWMMTQPDSKPLLASFSDEQPELGRLLTVTGPLTLPSLEQQTIDSDTSLGGPKLTWAVFMVWMVGVLIRTARLLNSYFKVMRLTGSAELLDQDLVAGLVADVPERAAVVRVRFGVSDQIGAPAAVGILHRMILIPRDLWSRLSSSQIRAVVHHELAHLWRFDPAWLLIQHIAGTLFWPQPLIHFLNRALSRAREEVCDNFVLHTYRSADYSRTLLTVARTAKPAPNLAVSLLSGRWRLEERIRTILDTRRTTMTKVKKPYMAATAVGIAVFAIAMATAIPTSAQDNTAGERPGSVELVFETSSEVAQSAAAEATKLSKPTAAGFKSLTLSTKRKATEAKSEVAELRQEVRQLREQFKQLMLVMQQGQRSRPNEDAVAEPQVWEPDDGGGAAARATSETHWNNDGRRRSIRNMTKRKTHTNARLAQSKAKLASLIAHQEVLKKQLNQNAQAIEELRRALEDPAAHTSGFDEATLPPEGVLESF